MPIVFSAPIQIIDQDLEFAAFNKDEHWASRFLGISVESLRGYRKKRIDKATGIEQSPRGPGFVKLNGATVRYSLQSLTEWVNSQPSGGQAPHAACASTVPANAS